MKRIPKPVFFIVVLLILAFAATSIFGVSYYVGDNKHTVIKGLSDVRWGIDIRGGVEATFKPAGDYNATDSQLDAAKAIIENRMISEGITDYELYADYNSDRIIVRFPWKDTETEYDPAAAIEEISSTALLTFRPGQEFADTVMGSDGSYVYKTPTGATSEVLMDGSSVKSASATMVTDDVNGGTSNVVNLELNESGAQKFKEITTKYEGQTVSIWMDDVMISAPTVQAVINDGLLRRCAPVHIDQIACDTEQVEGDTQGLHQPRQLDGPHPGQLRQQLPGEAQIFVKVQKPEAGDQRRCQHQPFFPGMGFHPPGRQEGGRRDRHQQRQVPGHAQQIEQPAGTQQQEIAPALRHKGMACCRQQQQDDVFQRIWHHRIIRLYVGFLNIISYFQENTTKKKGRLASALPG